MTKNRKSRRKSQHRKFESKSTSETKYDGDNAIAVALDSTTSSQSYLHEVVSKSGVATELSISISSVESSNKERKNVLVHEELSLSFSETSSKKRKRNEPEAETYRDNNGNSGANKRWLIDDCVETRSGLQPSTAIIAEPDFPFPIDPDDHCESPMEAYRDIVSLLTFTGTRIYSKTSFNMLRIYDPYYCDGAVIRNFTELGFSNVRNCKEDCYTAWETATLSSDNNVMETFDALVTNPPYSGNHIERLMQFVTSDKYVRSRKPWFLLLPQWVHKKDYYINSTTNKSHAIQPFYLIPQKRYIYKPPPNFRCSKKSDVHKKSSPFVSMWYCWGGTTLMNDQLIQQFYISNNTTCDLARSKNAIRDLRRQQTKLK